MSDLNLHCKSHGNLGVIMGNSLETLGNPAVTYWKPWGILGHGVIGPR
ncbi:hypothetical protein CHOED_085 [Vibrio phage CHOED]|nr:hypothetical protein CHOED_085 [Vibrio phage CHOED]AHK11945.1 hypothetical protein CHOED_085 [Vibrio phage CHOED]